MTHAPVFLALLLLATASCGLVSGLDQFTLGSDGGGLASGAGGAGGAGGAQLLPCATQADCPADEPCAAYTCMNGTCQASFAAAGTPVPGSPIGDCRSKVCGENGTVTDAPDDTDIFDDGNDCTEDTCFNGTPQQVPSPDGAPCGVPGSGLYCDAGVCTGCTAPEQCLHGACQDPTCIGMQCGTVQKPAGTVVNDANNDDCIRQVCDGAGMIMTAEDPDDVPDDMDDCTVDTCNGSIPEHSPAMNGTVCLTGYCYVGICSECGIDGNCSASECYVATCDGGVCQATPAPDGTNCGAFGDMCCSGVCTSGVCP